MKKRKKEKKKRRKKKDSTIALESKNDLISKFVWCAVRRIIRGLIVLWSPNWRTISCRYDVKVQETRTREGRVKCRVTGCMLINLYVAFLWLVLFCCLSFYGIVFALLLFFSAALGVCSIWCLSGIFLCPADHIYTYIHIPDRQHCILLGMVEACPIGQCEEYILYRHTHTDKYILYRLRKIWTHLNLLSIHLNRLLHQPWAIILPNVIAWLFHCTWRGLTMSDASNASAEWPTIGSDVPNPSDRLSRHHRSNLNPSRSLRPKHFSSPQVSADGV